jgi:competence protein ComGC
VIKFSFFNPHGCGRPALANDGAFSVVEIIGLLALLAILASLLVPQILKTRSPAQAAAQTVNRAHVEQVVAGLAAIKAAITSHHAQFGSLASSNGLPLTVSGSYDHYDLVLLGEGLLDRPFTLTIGTKAVVRLVDVSGLSAATVVDGRSAAYDLDGDGKNDVVGASYVVELVLFGLTEDEARAVNERVDGPALAANSTGNDLLGQVTWRRPTPGSPLELHIYLVHH